MRDDGGLQTTCRVRILSHDVTLEPVADGSCVDVDVDDEDVHVMMTHQLRCLNALSLSRLGQQGR